MNDQNIHEAHESDVTIQEAQTVKVGVGGSNLGTPAAIIAGAAIIAAALYFGLQGSPGLPIGSGTPVAPGAPSAPTEPVDVSAGDLPVLGDASAPVLIVEWADFQCPFCGRLHSDVFSPVREQYIQEGKVRWAYRDFAFLGQESVDAAMAARCANEQGKFWAYHDHLFENQAGENQNTFSRDNLKRFARELGLDTAQFNTCLDSDKYEDAVAADTNAGRDAGVSGTPTTFVNGRMLSGAQPLANFTKIIDEELNK